MSYDGKVLAAAREQYELDKERRAAEFRRRRQEIYARDPKLKEIESGMRRTMIRVLSASLRHGQDPAEAVERQHRENTALQKERAAHLAALGLPADALSEKPACALCNDTGYGKDGGLCSCLKAYYIAEQTRQLSMLLHLGSQSFERFRLDYYPDDYREKDKLVPRAHMEKVEKTCRLYAANFGRSTGLNNLFLTGEPGLGKTFLSACIAREVSQQGFSVVYDTASHVFSRFETEKFRRGSEDEQEDAAADVRRYLGCDLLILDDLGTELTTPLVQDVLYQLINQRLISEKRTIISSNLTEGDLRRRYSPQIASRLCGEYRMLPFFGDDIRKLRQREGL